MEYPIAFVVALGLGVVFIGLISIIVVCKIVSAVCGAAKGNEASESLKSATASASVAQPIENRREVIAAVSAALAEEMGTDVGALRILSFKKI